MIEYTPYRARDQPQSSSASQHRKDKIMHKFEKRDAKSRTLVILAVVGLAAALTLGIFTAVRLIRKPAASKDDPKTSIVYDSSAVEGGWDNLSPEEIAEKLNEKVAEGMINISMNTAPYFEDGKAEGNVMIVNESINNYPQQLEFIRNDISMNPQQWQKHSYVACCGTSPLPVMQMLKPETQIVYLCLDNDDAGHKASERMAEQLRERGVMTERLVPELKDWNEDLLHAQKEELAPCLSL